MLPFSAIILCPPNTTSVVDSPSPAFAYTYPAISLADCPEISCLRYASFPTVSSLAEQFTTIVAPASAA